MELGRTAGRYREPDPDLDLQFGSASGPDFHPVMPADPLPFDGWPQDPREHPDVDLALPKDPFPEWAEFLVARDRQSGLIGISRPA
jgi:hypothetical protein